MKKNIQIKMQKNIKDVPHFGSVAHLNLLIALFLILLRTTAHSQSFTVFDIDTTDFPIMRAKFYAFDAEGKQIKNISTNEITVYEDGVEREVLSISCPESKPVSISSVITTDISGSMQGDPLEWAKEGTRAWIKGLPDGKFECALTTFNNCNFMVQEFTNDKLKLLSQVNTYNEGGGTNYNAAMISPLFGGLLVTDNAQYKKVLVVVSDGKPNFEPQTQQIINLTKQKGVVVYSVTLRYKCPNNLKQISEQSGGQWFENITTEDEARDIYLTILNHSQEINPCIIEWKSEEVCHPKKIILNCEYNSFVTNNYYEISLLSLSRLVVDPILTSFDEPEVGIKTEKKIIVKAINSDFTINDILKSNNNFYVEPKSFSLQKNESIELTVSYTAPEKGYAFCKFEFLTNLCSDVFFANAYHIGYPPLQEELKLTHPIGGEKYLVGSDTIITWEGIPEAEPVKIEFSNNDGKLWQTLSDSAIGLIYDWNKIPNNPSDECKIKIKQMIKQDTSLSTYKILWENNYGGSKWDEANSIDNTLDGGYIVAGFTMSNDIDINNFKGDIDYFVVKLKHNGDLEWANCYGGSSSDRANSVKQTEDGGYIVAGETRSHDGDLNQNYGSYDSWVLKLNYFGEIEWQNQFGGSEIDQAKSVVQTEDGGYLVAGVTRSDDGDLKSNYGLRDIFILKLDEFGDKKWYKTFGGTNDEDVSSIIITDDGGYIVAGYTMSENGDINEQKGVSDFWIIKLYKNGDLEWQKTFGGKEAEKAKSIKQTLDGGYIVAGYTSSNDGDISELKGISDYWIIKL